MCTCITFRANEFYFGRNLDLDVSFGEKVAVTPRNYPFHFRVSSGSFGALRHDRDGKCNKELPFVCRGGE